jgi:hypothetical protein
MAISSVPEPLLTVGVVPFGHGGALPAFITRRQCRGGSGRGKSRRAWNEHSLFSCVLSNHMGNYRVGEATLTPNRPLTASGWSAGRRLLARSCRSCLGSARAMRASAFRALQAGRMPFCATAGSVGSRATEINRRPAPSGGDWRFFRIADD